MTGFHRRTFLLEFEDPSFGGLEVRTRSAALGDLMRMQELMETQIGRLEHAEERRELYERLGGSDERAGLIIEWNLLDDSNEPVPTTAEQLEKEEWPLIRAICRAWVRALVDVSPPLSQPSSDGDRLEGLHIPMTTLPAASDSLENQTSSNEPNES